MANIELIKKLREETGISIAECNKALTLSGGNIDRAKEIIKEWGRDVAAKKAIGLLASALLTAISMLMAKSVFCWNYVVKQTLLPGQQILKI